MLAYHTTKINNMEELNLKCKVCGDESGKYPLCRNCYKLKEAGQIIKCEKCGNWHFSDIPCPEPDPNTENDKYLYEIKKQLLTPTEQKFYDTIKSVLPENYTVFPQINLAAFIDKTDDSKYQSELFRNVDFLITDSEYKPKVVIEINDQSHLNRERYIRDEKVLKICEEAGLPLIKLWVSYGIKPDYIQRKIKEAIDTSPTRVHHFTKIRQTYEDPSQIDTDNTTVPQKNKACYVATCVYGSYDCPQVWVLRRFRDNVLQKCLPGRLFIKTYYMVSPTIIKVFHNQKLFINVCKKLLDRLVDRLKNKGFTDTPYED